MHRTVVLLASLLTLAACASEPKRLPPAQDPSSPEAPEAPPAPLPGTLSAPVATEPPASTGAGHAHPGAPATARDAGVTVYVCPMHPEVRSDTPGSCPKCGMKLVPEPPQGPSAPDAGRPSAAPEHQHGGHP